MKANFPDEMELLETIIAEKEAINSSSSKRQILFESEKIIDGQYYHVIATSDGDVYETKFISGQYVNGVYKDNKVRTRCYYPVYNELYGHQFTTFVSYKVSPDSIVSGDSRVYEFVNCKGYPTRQISVSNPARVDWFYEGRIHVDDPSGEELYNKYRQRFYLENGQPKCVTHLWL